MTDHSSAEFTRDELFQAFKGVEIAYAAKLKERGELPFLFDHCGSVLREFKSQFPLTSPEAMKALQSDFLRRHR